MLEICQKPDEEDNMRKLLIFILGLCIALGCIGSEQPLVPDEDEEHLEVIDGQAPETEVPTTVVYIPGGVSGAPAFIHAVVGGNEKVTVYRDGMIEEVNIHFQKPRAYYFRGTFELVGIWKDEEHPYFNVLDNNIPPRPSDEEREQIISEFRKERGIAEGDPLGIDDRFDLNDRIYHNEPFKHGDEIEVVIKHRGKVIREKHVKADPQFQIREKIIRKEIEMVFVDVIRNLTRPHIIYQ